MANKIQIKRGGDLSNAGTPAAGELVYKTGTNELFVGDGSTAASSLTAIGGSATSVTLGGHTMNDVDIGSEFNDVDDHLMTSGAIKEKIEAYGYTTAAGTVDTSGSPVDNDYAKFTDANTLEGRSYAELATDLNLGDLATLDDIPANKVSSGTLDAARIPTIDISSKTNLSAGTNISLSGDTLNVDDAFLKNDASDTMSGSLTVTGVVHVQSGDDFALGEITNTLRMKGNSTTGFNFLNNGNGWAHLNCGNVVAAGSVSIGGHAVDDIDVGSEFVDADDHLMTSGAIKEKIESYGYSTGGGISHDGSTANGVLTYKDADEATVESSLTFDGTNLDLPDSKYIRLGTGNDLRLYHDGTNSSIENHTGNLYIDNNTNDGEIIFRCDDGSGGVTQYFALNGTNTRIDVNKTIKLDDDARLDLGTGSDFKMWHDGSHNYMQLNNGNLYFRDDGSNNVFTIYREGGGVQLNEGNLKLPATSALYFDGGSNTYIQEGSGDRLDFVVGGDTMLVMDEANDYNASYKDVRLNDDLKLWFGSHSDVYLYYEPTNDDFYIRNANGDTKIRNEATDADIIFSNDDGSGGNTNYMVIDGGAVAIDLLQDTRLKAAKKLFLDGGGNTYLWENDADSVYMTVGGANVMRFYETSNVGYAYAPDNYYVGVGSGIDFTMRHDGSHSYLRNETGDLYITNVTSNEDIIIRVNDGGSQINAIYIDSSNTGMVKLQNDLQYLTFGSSDDGILYSYQDNFYITNQTAGKDTIFTNLNSDSSSHVEIMRLDGSTSRVGIGTNSPDELLEVAGTAKISSTGNTTLYIDGAGNGYTSGQIVFQGSDDDASYRGTGVFNHDAASDIEYFSGTLYANDAWAVCRKTSVSSHDSSVAQGSNALFIIEGGGDVGIGTSNPANKFTVNSTSAYQASIQYDASTRFRISVEDSGRTRFYTDNSADVGVESGDFYVQPTNKIYLDGGNDTYLDEVSANEIAFNTGGAERMRLTTGGLGIGIDPAEVLDLKSSSGDCRIRMDAPDGSDCEIKFYNAGAVQYTFGYDDGMDQMRIGTSNVDSGVLLAIDSAGHTGINETNPTTELHLGTCPDARAITFDQSGRYNGIGNYFSSNATDSRIDFFLSDGGTNGDTNQEFAMYASGNFHADADVIAFSSSVGSDIKLKKNIEDIGYGLDDVLKMRAVEFDWKEKRQGKHDIGVIAQEIEKIIPEVVQEVDTLKTDGETHKVVDYAKLTSVLIKAIQEQQEEIDLLKANYSDLKYNRR